MAGLGENGSPEHPRSTGGIVRNVRIVRSWRNCPILLEFWILTIGLTIRAEVSGKCQKRKWPKNKGFACCSDNLTFLTIVSGHLPEHSGTEKRSENRESAMKDLSRDATDAPTNYLFGDAAQAQDDDPPGHGA